MKSCRAQARAALLCAAVLLAGCVTSESGKQIALDYYNIGNAFFDLGQYDKAVQYYQNALRADPGMVKADYNLALTLVRMKRSAEAVTVLLKLLAADDRRTRSSWRLSDGLTMSWQKTGKPLRSMTRCLPSRPLTRTPCMTAASSSGS